MHQVPQGRRCTRLGNNDDGTIEERELDQDGSLSHTKKKETAVVNLCGIVRGGKIGVIGWRAA